jgi:hypothetical protein
LNQLVVIGSEETLSGRCIHGKKNTQNDDTYDGNHFNHCKPVLDLTISADVESIEQERQKPKDGNPNGGIEVRKPERENFLRND